MSAHGIWAVFLAEGGREVARITLPSPAPRAELPLRDLASAGLRHDASAMIVVRDAADVSCTPCAEEMNAIAAARSTLGAIGVRLHDYILWHGETCVSLRQTGKL